MTKAIANEITAIILAGGESSRMGQDKALLPIGSQTLLGQVCSVAQDATNQVYVVTPWVEKYRSIVPLGCQLIKEELVLNAPSNTPIIGFAQGLQLVSTKWVLLLACDLPHISLFPVKQWSKALATVFPTEMACLPRSPKGWEALSGFYRRDCLASLLSYIELGGKSFQGWLTQIQVKELVLSDRTCLFNCNTPADWQVSHTLWQKKTQSRELDW